MAVERYTVDLSDYPDLVVIYLGMRARSLRGLKTLLSFGPRIQKAVATRPDGLLLHENLVFSLVPPHAGMRQYWRDFDSLERWARSGTHRKWWQGYLRDIGGNRILARDLLPRRRDGIRLCRHALGRPGSVCAARRSARLDVLCPPPPGAHGGGWSAVRRSRRGAIQHLTTGGSGRGAELRPSPLDCAIPAQGDLSIRVARSTTASMSSVALKRATSL